MPVTVTGYVPGAEVAAIDSVSTELLAVTPGGENVAVVPTGPPLAESVTVPAKPFVRFTFTVTLPCDPAVTESVPAARLNVYPGGGVTVAAIVTL